MTMLLRHRRNLFVLARRAFWLVMIVSLPRGLPCFHARENCLAGAEEKPAVTQPAPESPASNNASRELLEDFQRFYALPDDKVIKRVAPPFSPGRLEYYRVHDPEPSTRKPNGPEFMWFRWADAKPGESNPFREGKLRLVLCHSLILG
jgi:hypothetical protein